MYGYMTYIKYTLIYFLSIVYVSVFSEKESSAYWLLVLQR